MAPPPQSKKQLVAGSSNVKPATIFTGDNLPIMRGMNSESVDLIYLDPPFNSKANYAAPIGSEAAGAAFKDTWSLDDIKTEWVNLIETKHPELYRVILAAMSPSDKSYLVYMASRLLEMYRILKQTGSIYLHCDPTMSHYLKLMMDAIFGKKNFRNEIIWFYPDTPGRPKTDFPRKHDVIFRYAKSKSWIFEDTDIRVDILEKSKQRYKSPRNIGGRSYVGGKSATRGKIPEDVWRIPAVKANTKEYKGYPTQKPRKLLWRIIKASTKKDDIVFDPFCGCATALAVADDEDRSWIGIDISKKAVSLVKERIRDQQGLFKNITHRTDIPVRTDQGEIPPYNCKENKKYLYGQQEGLCAGCKTLFEARSLEVDHIIAVSSGGTDHISNLQLLCGSCNRIKGNRGMDFLNAKLNLDNRQWFRIVESNSAVVH